MALSVLESIHHANVFCIEAQIKLGEMLKEMPKKEERKIYAKAEKDTEF